jgi:hypothetical protein
LVGVGAGGDDERELSLIVRIRTRDVQTELP